MYTPRTGDMFQALTAPTDQILVTTNAAINSFGNLVMGRGAARQAALLYPHVPGALARIIRIRPSPYYLILPCSLSHIGAVQVKHHWADDADPKLINESFNRLGYHARLSPSTIYNVNYPGIGNGRLDQHTVAGILEPLDLPTNLHIWTFR